MTDASTIARRYIELWNEKTPSRRREKADACPQSSLTG